MGCFRGHWVTIDGNPVWIEPNCTKQTAAVAATLVLTAVVGGGVGDAASASGAADEFSANARMSEARLKYVSKVMTIPSEQLFVCDAGPDIPLRSTRDPTKAALTTQRATSRPSSGSIPVSISTAPSLNTGRETTASDS